jgi:hypothetical protein
MKLHANARLSPNGRRLLIDRLELDGWDIREAAGAAGISVRTARKWLGSLLGTEHLARVTQLKDSLDLPLPRDGRPHIVAKKHATVRPSVAAMGGGFLFRLDYI